MELLLVVAVLAVLAPVTFPAYTAYVASRGDVAATYKLIDLVSHTRSMGLMVRGGDSTIVFTNNSASVSAGGTAISLPDGYTVSGFKVDGSTVTNLSVLFKIDGNIRCNNADASAASIDLKRDGTTISIINMNGIGVPVPQMTAAVDPANPSGASGSGGCRWF